MGITLSQMVVQKRAIERSLCQQSFFDFFLRFWHTVCTEKLVLNWHIEYLCNELQIITERVFKREPKLYDLVVNVPPGSTKSTIFSEMYPAWCWTRDRSYRLICGSHRDRLALDLAERCSRIVLSDKYKELFPEVELNSENKSHMKVAGGGERVATSVGTTPTGLHAHSVVIDDPLDPEKALSELDLATSIRWQEETMPSRVIDISITPFILVMQRLTEGDNTGNMLAKARARKNLGMPVRHVCLPAEIDDGVRPRGLRKFYVGGLFDPIRLPAKSLEAKKLDMGEYAYAGQYGQRPSPRGGGFFKTDHLTIWPTLPKMLRTIRFWDKAGTPKSGAYTVGVKMGIDKDKTIWVIDVVRGQWEAASRERVIQQTAKLDGPKTLIVVEQEPGSGGLESAEATLKNLIGYRAVKDRPTGDKIIRADPYAAQVNAGNVKLLKADWNQAYISELSMFWTGKYKDQVDASSGAFNWVAGKRLRAGAF